MAPYKAKSLLSNSGSEDDKSSGSDSDSSDSGSESKSEAGSVRSHQSAASRSASSSRSAQSPVQARSRSASAESRSSSEGNGEGNLVLDERKSHSRSRSNSRSRSRSRSSSSASSASLASKHSEEEKEGKVTAQSSPAQEETTTKKAKRIIDSDADSASDSDAENKREKAGAASPTAEALFGENVDISSEDDDDDDGAKATQKLPEKATSDGDRDSIAGRRDEEMEQDDDFGGRDNEKDKEPEEIVPETKIEHEIPYIRADVGKEFHFVKLPNFLSVEPRPYDPETYEDELEEEETLDEEGRARLKLKVENTIRWRTAFDKDGNAFKESNARMVKWSDGSLSLHLGSEIFDVYRQPLQGDHNHLFIRQGTGLQGQAVFRTKLTFRPHSTDSFTHRKMTKSLAERSTKTSAIKIIGTVGADPEANRGEKIKKEEERLRASVRRESKQKRIRERTAIGRGMSGSYLEPDREGYDDSEEEGAISLTAIKNKYKRGGARDSRPSIYSSEEDASDIEDRKAKKLERAKALRDSDEDENGDEAGGSGTNKVRVVSSSSDEESD